MKKRKIAGRSRSAEDSGCFIDRKLSTIYITGEINQRMASLFRKYFRSLEAVKAEIIIEINSPGGDIQAGLAIVDTIRLCKKSVVTRVTGEAMSMGSVILAVGKKREALELSSIMVHQGSFSLHARADEIETEVKELQRLETLCWAILDSRCGKPSGYWEKLCNRKNKYLSAAQAKAEGLVDEVL
jgi:ATP-dependent Clp protease protease subunit